MPDDWQLSVEGHSALKTYRWNQDRIGTSMFGRAGTSWLPKAIFSAWNMSPMKRSLIALLVPVLASCSPSSAPHANMGGAASTQRPVKMEGHATATSGAGQDDPVVMSKVCGSAELELHCPHAGEDALKLDCRATSISLRTADTPVSYLDKPAEMSKYTAVGLGCATARDGSAYFVVQYGELPFGCQFCEWNYLYDQDGRQLTHSQPAILQDASLPGDGKQYPNNQEFEAKHKQLGLSQPEIEFLACDVRMDTAGEPVCEKESRDARG